MTTDTLAIAFSLILNCVRLIVHSLNQINSATKEPYPFTIKEIVKDARAFYYYLNGNLFKQSEYDEV